MYDENYFYDSVNDSTNDNVMEKYPDISSNPVVPVELKETVVLIGKSFSDALAEVSKRGSKTVRRRRPFIMYYLAEAPDTRPSRSEIAELLEVSISTIDKTIEFCRNILAEKCVQHGLPPAAFENLVKSL